jgi:hypothetical protein
MRARLRASGSSESVVRSAPVVLACVRPASTAHPANDNSNGAEEHRNETQGDH